MRDYETLVLPVTRAHRPVEPFRRGSRATHGRFTRHDRTVLQFRYGEGRGVAELSTSPSQQVASWPMSPEPTNPGRPSPRVETHSADLTTNATDWKSKITGSCGRCKSDHCSASLASASTVPNNCTSRMLKKSASFVLASFGHSTYPRGYASGSSFATALLGGLFEHPELYSPVGPDVTTGDALVCQFNFSPTARHVLG